MKKSELKAIIKECYNELLNEEIPKKQMKTYTFSTYPKGTYGMSDDEAKKKFKSGIKARKRKENIQIKATTRNEAIKQFRLKYPKNKWAIENISQWI